MKIIILAVLVALCLAKAGQYTAMNYNGDFTNNWGEDNFWNPNFGNVAPTNPNYGAENQFEHYAAAYNANYGNPYIPFARRNLQAFAAPAFAPAVAPQ